MIRRNGVVSRAAFAAIGCWCASGVAVATEFQPVDFSPYQNDRMQNWGVDTGEGEAYLFPKGSVTLGGVPFQIPALGNNTWTGNISPTGTETVNIPIGVSGATEVCTLITTVKGVSSGSLASLEFFGSAGAFYQLPLYGGVDMRDWLDSDYTNTINGTSTVNVVDVGSGYHEESRLDMQQITLPDAFWTQTLVSMEVVDSGYIVGETGQRINLSGLTVAYVPEPSCTLLLVLATSAASLRHRRSR